MQVFVFEYTVCERDITLLIQQCLDYSWIIYNIYSENIQMHKITLKLHWWSLILQLYLDHTKYAV